MDGRLLFDDLDCSSRKIAGVNKGQQDLLALIERLAGDGEWVGSRSEIAKPLGCSVDTVTRRKDRLVELGLLAVEPRGRMLAYRVHASRGVSAPGLQKPPATSAAQPAPKRRWWRRPDANQLDLFNEPTTRTEAATRLAATTLQWMSLVVSLVIGCRPKPPTSAATPTARPATPATISPAPPAETTTPTTKPPEAIASIAIEPTPTTTSAERLLSPILQEPPSDAPVVASLEKPVEEPPSDAPVVASLEKPVEGRSLKKFALWRNAKESDFQEPVMIQQIFERLKTAGGCTDDERLHVFRFVANAIRLKKPHDNIPGLVTSVLRGSGTPWRARGDAEDERTAREQIASLKPVELQTRTGNLDGPDDLTELKNQQRRALLAKYGI